MFFSLALYYDTVKCLSTNCAPIPTEGEKNTRRGLNCVCFFKLYYKCFISLSVADKNKHKDITKKWKSHLEVWVAKRHLHRWLLAKPYIYIYIYIYTGSSHKLGEVQFPCASNGFSL